MSFPCKALLLLAQSTYSESPAARGLRRRSKLRPPLGELGQHLLRLLGVDPLQLLEEGHVELDVLALGHVIDQEAVVLAVENHGELGAILARRGMGTLDRLVGNGP